MSKQIVLVDDDQGMLLLTKNILTNEGYAVETFDDANKAFHFIDKTRVDLLLIDIMMPAMNGVEAVKTISKNEKVNDLNIIFMTGIFDHDQQDVADVTVEGHTYKIIRKPVEPRKLIETVREVFSS